MPEQVTHGSKTRRVLMNQFNPVIPGDAAFYRGILDQMSDGVYMVDRTRQILSWSEGARRLTGYTGEEVIGRYCGDEILCHVDYAGKRLCQDRCLFAACMHDGQGREARAFLRHKQGRRVPVLVRVQPLRAGDGSVVGAIEIFSDDTARTEALRKIEGMRKMAHLDHLTQLPNRRLLELSLQCAMNEFQTMGMPFGLLFFDLDAFKEINDQFGHAAGDRVLLEIAKTLVASLRPTDVVGRWGGDEFLAIVHNANTDLLEELSRRCAAMVTETSVAVRGNARVRPSTSVGVAMIRAGESAEELFHRADQMMYQRKWKHRGRTSADAWSPRHNRESAKANWLFDLLDAVRMPRTLTRHAAKPSAETSE
jgi:diguanylate cyclase (GGDEF)-like protein/PAS domain S-box-containing protein